jgi:hypothetical protein
MANLDHEKFNKFIFSIDDSMDELQEIAKKHNVNLDFSKPSLGRLESLILKMKVRPEDGHSINILGQYLGEYMCKNHGGSWKLGDDPNDEFNFDMPCISGHNTAGNFFNPIEIVENYLADPFDGLFVSAIDAEFDYDSIDIQPEE